MHLKDRNLMLKALLLLIRECISCSSLFDPPTHITYYYPRDRLAYTNTILFSSLLKGRQREGEEEEEAFLFPYGLYSPLFHKNIFHPTEGKKDYPVWRLAIAGWYFGNVSPLLVYMHAGAYLHRMAASRHTE